MQTEMAALVDNSNNINRRKWCSISYKIRCFYSKGAFLVLFWMSLIILTSTYSCLIIFRINVQEISSMTPFEIALVPAVPFLPVLFAPIVGWIADARCGNYRMFRVGASLLFLTTVVGCICVLILLNVPPHSNVSRVVSDGISPIVYIIGFVGLTACLVTALQLGLDQMPDASSANITSFIAWFVFSIALGVWILNTSFNFSCIGLFNLRFFFDITSIQPNSSDCHVCTLLFIVSRCSKMADH